MDGRTAGWLDGRTHGRTDTRAAGRTDWQTYHPTPPGQTMHDKHYTLKNIGKELQHVLLPTVHLGLLDFTSHPLLPPSPSPLHPPPLLHLFIHD